MIDNAANPDSSGCFLLDRRMDSPSSKYWEGEQWMIDASNELSSMGVECALNQTYNFLTNCHAGSIVPLTGPGDTHTLNDDLMGYCSWGSNDGSSHINSQWARPQNTWKKGSISTTHVSSSGRTFYGPDYSGPAPIYYNSTAPAGELHFTNCGQGWSAVLHNNSTEQEQTSSCTNGTISFSLPSEITDGYVRFFFPDGSLIDTATLLAGPATPLAPTVRYRMRMQSALSYQSSSPTTDVLEIMGCWQGWTGVLRDTRSGEEILAVASPTTMTFPISHDIADGYLQLYYSDGSLISSPDNS